MRVRAEIVCTLLPAKWQPVAPVPPATSTSIYADDAPCHADRPRSGRANHLHTPRCVLEDDTRGQIEASNPLINHWRSSLTFYRRSYQPRCKEACFLTFSRSSVWFLVKCYWWTDNECLGKLFRNVFDGGMKNTEDVRVEKTVSYSGYCIFADTWF